MFCLVPLPDMSFRAAVTYYGRVANSSNFWEDVAPDPNNGSWIGRLIPAPTKWAPLFLDYPDLGMAFKRALKLVAGVDEAEQKEFRGFALSMMFACCLDANRKKNSQHVVHALETPAEH